MLPLVAITFAAVLTVVLASYYVLVVRPEARAESIVKARLKRAAGIHKPAASLMKQRERLSQVSVLEALLRRASVVADPLREAIQQAGLRTNVGTVLLACACAGLAAFLLVVQFTQSVLFGFPAAALAAWGPVAFLRMKRNRRIAQFEEQFPEAIDLVGRALRAGHAFTTGLSMVADEAPQPVAGEFRILFEQQNYGMPLTDALREFARRIPLIDAQFFATAVLTQREAGGNLAEVLDNLARVMRERFRVKRQVRVISAHGRITGWVLACLPPVLATAFLAVTPKHMHMLVDDPLGQRMVVTAVMLQVVGSLIIRRIVRIEY